MTTNHLEKLDKALIRPGRADVPLEFGRCNTEMSAELFRNFYMPLSDDLDDIADHSLLRKAAELMAPEERRAEIKALIVKQAVIFSAKIPEHQFAAAEIQGLLWQCPCPGTAIAKVDEWIHSTRNMKEAREDNIASAHC